MKSAPAGVATKTLAPPLPPPPSPCHHRRTLPEAAGGAFFLLLHSVRSRQGPAWCTLLPQFPVAGVGAFGSGSVEGEETFRRRQRHVGLPGNVHPPDWALGGAPCTIAVLRENSYFLWCTIEPLSPIIAPFSSLLAV